jgi:Na+-driven multidrug efflux pump
VVLLPAAWLLAQTGRLELVWLSFWVAEGTALIMNIFFLRHTMRSAQERIGTPETTRG